jgi:hypothetical protein
MTVHLESLPLPEALQRHISTPVTPSDLFQDRKAQLYRVLHPKVVEFCTSCPDFHDSDWILSYFISTFPSIVASHPDAFVFPFRSPFESALSMVLLNVYVSVSEFELAAKSGAQLRLRILLFAIRRAIEGKPQCKGVAAVIEHVLQQPFVGIWDADLDVHPPEGKGRHNQWMAAEEEWNEEGEWD